MNLREFSRYGYAVILSMSFIYFSCGADQIIPKCYNDTTYVTSSAFERNLHAVMSLLNNNTAITGYYNTSTSGQDPDNVYGVSLCRGDISTDNCSSCIVDMTTQIVNLCPSSKAASIWSYYCQITYSYQNIFGQPDDENYFFRNSSSIDVSEYPFKTLLQSLLNKLQDMAVNDPTGKYFATGKVEYNSTNNIYGLVQCRRDLSKVDCGNCFSSLFAIVPFCCSTKEGWFAYRKTCGFRYEMYLFFKEAQSPSPTPSPKGQAANSNSYILILALAIPGAFLVLATTGFLLWKRHSFMQDGRRKAYLQGDPPHERIQMTWLDSDVGTMDFPLYDLCTIKAATGDFAEENLLGMGGYGSVYKGILNSGETIAVKRLTTQSTEREHEFYSEAKLVAKLQHRNLVQLLGCCLEGDEMILVYEYMENGSLDVILFDPLRRTELDWQTRLRIILGVARGVLYLHEDSQLKIIHRDLKVANILLDREFNPKISDFGLAKLFVMNENEGNTFTIAGSRGYMSPEYLFNGTFSVKSDVFSVGVIILEIVCGERNLSRTNTGPDNHVTAKAWNLWRENRSIDLVDLSLIETCDKKEALRCIRIGLLCVQETEEERPNMSQVMMMLSTPTLALPRPQPPAYFFTRSTTTTSLCEPTGSTETFTDTTQLTSKTSTSTTQEAESDKSAYIDWTEGVRELRPAQPR